MIPVSLSLKNFLSYGENVPPLDFTEFDIACLSGNNGHGKSALLDAMTWALWGEARKASGDKSPADGLLRIGATDMRVEFAFDLEGDRYRVIRKFQRKRGKSANSATLEFQVFDEAHNGYKPMTENSLRQTQERINATLRMNYDTFINSAFILQGRVDEFTRKTPHKRKEILADILDLQRYEQLVELAKAHQGEAKLAQKVLEERLKIIDAELAHQPEYEREFDRLTQRIEAANGEIDTRERERAALQRRQAELLVKQAQLREKQQQRQQCERDAARLMARLKELQAQIGENEAILTHRDAIVAQAAAHDALQARLRECDEKKRQFDEQDARRRALLHAIAFAEQDVKNQLSAAQTQHAQFQQQRDDMQAFLARRQEIEAGFCALQQAKAAQHDFENRRGEDIRLALQMKDVQARIDQENIRLATELKEVERECAKLGGVAGQLPQREQELARCREQAAACDALKQRQTQTSEAGTLCAAQEKTLADERQRLADALNELAEKIELLKRSDAPQCPLCASRLDPQKRGEIETHFQQEMQALQAKQAQTEQERQTASARLDALRAEYKQIGQQIAALEKSPDLLFQAEHACRESLEAVGALEERRREVERRRAQLDGGDFAPDARREWQELSAQRAAVGYNQDEHRRVSLRAQDLERFNDEHLRLAHALEQERTLAAQFPELAAKIAELSARLAQRQFAQAEQAEIEEIARNIERIGYDAAAHSTIRRDAECLAFAPARKAELDQADTRLAGLRQAFEERQAEHGANIEQTARLDEDIRGLEQDAAAFESVESALKQAANALHALRLERDQAIQQRGTAEHQYAQCQQLRLEQAQKRQEKSRVDADETIYGDLVRIFGKDGMQAHLIANAIPEIEDEANAILSRLTQNRTQIAIEPLRDLQSGKTKETLDIKISDEMGTRSYEMYSGGEAFRVDFAIRIALSKLLANRAGTKLKTLVIDEGFGTQDAQALEQLVEAIKAIRGDFEKILVITHLETLKDVFPVRIEVVKLPDIGSQFQVVR